MTQVFVHEIEKLKKQILNLSAQVEENVILAVQALLTRDADLAAQIMESDAEIDRQEVAVEEEALKILALYQPVAADLRFLTTVLKINNDLERIGDLAANIAKRARKLCKDPSLTAPAELNETALRARDMVHNSLSAFVNFDTQLAHSVCESDDILDEFCKKVTRFVEHAGKQNPENLKYYLTMLLAARNLERIGDHATNIAEDVIYLVDGIIVRHNTFDDDE